MTHYSVVSVSPTSEAWIPGYLAEVGPLVSKHGGKYLARTASHELLEGPGPLAVLTVILEWPSREAEAAMYADPDYQPHLGARLAGSTSSWVSVSAVDDFA